MSSALKFLLVIDFQPNIQIVIESGEKGSTPKIKEVLINNLKTKPEVHVEIVKAYEREKSRTWVTPKCDSINYSDTVVEFKFT